MNGVLKIWILLLSLCLGLAGSTSRPWYTQNKKCMPVTIDILPFFLSSTIWSSNSSACLRWNGVVHLVDLDMAIAWTGLPLVWDLHVLTHVVAAFLVRPKVQKCSQSLENTCGGATHTSYGHVAAYDTHCMHMSYFVRRHCPYLVHFMCFKIECRNLWCMI